MELRYLDENLREATVPLSGPLIWIGRAPTCGLLLRDSRVSRLHACIECIESQYALTDNGSANGTFLNGLRLDPLSAFLLREGDDIEIGPVRCRFGAGAVPAGEALALSTFNAESTTSRPLSELLFEGRTLLVPSQVQRAFLLAFGGLSRPDGLARSLEHVAHCMSADVAAVFAPHPTRGVELVAAHPLRAAGMPLAVLAHDLMASDRGRLVRYPAPPSSGRSEVTCDESLASAAAVPFCAGPVPVGVLAVDRHGGRRLETSDLARLAVLGQFLGATLSLNEGDAQDTRLGLEATLEFNPIRL